MRLKELFEATSADNADLSDLEDSLNDFFDPVELDRWENFTIQNKGMIAFAKSVVKNDAYQDALHQNLKRIGIPNPVLVFRGHMKSNPAIDTGQIFANITLRRSLAKNFRQAKFISLPGGKIKNIDKEDWMVSEIVIRRDDIIAHGNTQESEFIILAKKAKIQK